MISIVDEREVQVNQLFIGDTFELLAEGGSDCGVALLRTDTQTTLAGALHLGYVNLETGVTKFIPEMFFVRKINVSMRIYQ